MFNDGNDQKDFNNFFFRRNPNIIYRETICKGSAFRGCKFIGNLGYNDIFDIYTPINEKDKNKIYLAIKSINNYSNITIIDIESNEIIYELSNGHEKNNLISMIKHYANIKTKKII